MRLQVLILEDEPTDAELAVREIRRSGFEVDWERVEDETAFVAQLRDNPPDVIISDYSMPQFSAPRALELLHEHRPDIPFVIVSGTIGEEVAVAAMRAGASDYLLKDRLARLGMAVRHLIEQRDDSRARLAAEKARRRLAAAVDQIAEGIVIVDSAGRVEYVNPSYERIDGRSRDETIGQLYWLLDRDAPPPGGDNQREEVLEALRASEPWQGRVDHPTPDGRSIEMDLSISAVRDEAGRVSSFVCVFRDVSERVLLERSLRQAQKMEAIGRLAGGMAHDFNNLLTAILGYGELTLTRLGEESPIHRDVSEIVAAGRRGAQLTRRLLSFSRRTALATETIDLNATVHDMEGLLGRLIGEDVTIRLDLDPATPAIRGDRSQIEQIVLNLAVNARDAMPSGGSLELASRRVVLDAREAARRLGLAPGVYAVLSVTDTGCGIDPETQARIFEPFFTTKETGEGTGLGLSMVFGIARQSGGSVEVTSEVGAGTEFRVYLPEAERSPPAEPAEPAPRPASAPDLPAPREGATIMVVEDEEATGGLVARLLREKGYEVMIARNGVEARLLADQRPEGIDLLLTDVVMPMISGPELAEELRARWPDLRVLFMTGYSGKLLEAHDFNSEHEHLVLKPFTLEELDRSVRRAIGGGEPS
jgi:PAS domain S-box-containing protein